MKTKNKITTTLISGIKTGFKAGLATTLTTTALTACALGANRSESPMNTSVNTNAKLHVFESDANGFNTKTVFYDNGKEVVAFDSQFTPDQARKAINFLRERTQNPIRFLVITHPNPDKFNGIPEFRKEGAKVVASRKTAENMPAAHEYKKYFFVNMAKMFTNESYPTLESPDQVFDQDLKLDLSGGDSIVLRELASPGISTNQTVALIPKANALVVGDLVHHKAHAWLEGGIQKGQAKPTLQGWIADLKELSSLYGANENLVVYGGRGQAAPLEEAITEQIAYLEKADRLVSQYVASLGARKVELQNAEAGKHYEQLTKIFEREFPGYDLGYMIQYGAYGLINSKL